MSDWQQQQPPGAPPAGPPAPGGFGAPPQASWGEPPPAQAPSRLEPGELLQTTARIVGGNFGVFFAVAFVAVLPGLAINQFFTARMQDRMFGFVENVQSAPGMLPDVSQMFSFADIGGLCVGALLSFTLMYLAQAVLVYDVVENLAGRKPPMGQAIATGLSRAPAVLGAAFLLTLVLTASVIPGAVLGVLVMAGGAAAGAGAAALATCCGGALAIVGVLVPVVYASIVFFVTVPAAVLENVGPIGALSRSLELTRGNRGRIFLAFLALGLVVFVLACVSGVCTGAVGAGGIDPATGMPQPPSTLANVVSFVTGLLIQTVQTMAFAALAAVTYARLRGVRDGVDAQALAEVFA